MRRVSPVLFLLSLASCSKIADLVGAGGTCNGPQPYTAGSTVTGVTNNVTCKGPDGTNGQVYSMTLSQQSNMALTLTASGFPGHLGLYTAANDLVAQTNDGSLRAFLPAGAYTVFVSSTSGKDGSYTLTSPAAELANCTTPGGITAKGASISGTLTATDCGNSLSKYDHYDIQLKAGTTLNVTFTVDRVAGLFVVGPTSQLAAREMAGAGTWTTSVTVPATGFYGVRVESRTTGNGASNLPLAYTISLN
jgi:hypothetical protein